MSKLQKIAALLKTDLIQIDGRFIHSSCTVQNQSTASGVLGSLQGFLKSYPRLYHLLIEILSPVCISQEFKHELRNHLKALPGDAIIVNLGSGPMGLPERRDAINVDIFSLKEVDVCSDATDVPFVDACADMIVNRAMLEHHPEPQKVVEEMFRLLKPGGVAVCYIPFLQPFHAAPWDYQRWTQPGLMRLFGKFTIQKTGIGAGPVSAWLWTSIEVAALGLSFRSDILRDLLKLLFMVTTFPIKYLDIILSKDPAAQSSASAFYVVAQRPPHSADTPACCDKESEPYSDLPRMTSNEAI